jgi:hypothetical protein
MKLFKKQPPYKRQLFAVTTGDYVGEMLAFMQTKDNDHIFLSVPKLVIRSIPIDKFKFGLDNSIVELVEVLPRNVFKLLEQQFKKNEKLNF